MSSDHQALAIATTISSAAAGAITDPDQLLAAYFSSSTVGLCILDSSLRYLALNEALARINGRPASDHLGRTVREVLGAFADVIEPQLIRVLTAGQAVSFEASALLPGRIDVGHWILHYLPITDSGGNITRIASIVIETTEQKKVEQSLQTVAQNLRNEMQRLQMLLDVSTLLGSGAEIQRIFPRVSARIRRVLRQELASLAIYDGAGHLVRSALDFPLSKGYLGAIERVMMNTPAGRSLQTRSPLIFSKEQLQEFDAEIVRALLLEGIQSLCCVPLIGPGAPSGVLVLGSTRRAAFHIQDLPLLNQISAQMSVAIGNQRAASEAEALKQRMGEEHRHLEGETRSAGRMGETVGESPELLEVLSQASIVAGSEATVLVLGETGTGKELVARAIHEISPRKRGPFIKVNCAAIPTGLLESELFGHEKGAFTGAVVQKVGRMELADGGTLFLDEVGEIPLELQPKLLRVLQDQEFERLGGTRTIRVNLRLIAATNRDLEKEMANRQFRSDLFYRLSVFPIQIPPLRQRRQDIPVLVRHFVRQFAQRMNREIETIPNETMQALMEWHWPGNVRELENLMERSVILSPGHALRVPLSELRSEDAGETSDEDQSLDSAEREHILRVLRECGGVLSGPDGAARRLGLKRTTLQSKMERLKITRRDGAPSRE